MSFCFCFCFFFCLDTVSDLGFGFLRFFLIKQKKSHSVKDSKNKIKYILLDSVSLGSNLRNLFSF